MVSHVFCLLALASAALAHPQRHNRFHGYGTGRSTGFALPTGATFPVNGTSQTNGTDFGGSPIESSSSVRATAIKTLTVNPVPLESGSTPADSQEGFSSVPNVNAVASDTAVAPAAGSSTPCSSSTSTITTTSVQFVTVTTSPDASEDSGKNIDIPSSSAPETSTTKDTGLEELASPSSISLVAGTPTAGAFFGNPGRGSGVASYGAGSSASAVVPSNGAESSTPAVVPTTLVTATSGVPSSAAESFTASAPASSSSSTPSTGGSTSGKKGLSYNDASLTNAFAGKGISWAYNWAAKPDGTIVSGAEYVPMLWGVDSESSWASAAASAIAAGSKHALSYNEPDLSTQSNIDPQTAASGHIEYMNPLAGQVQIGSPAITNGGGSMGTGWLQNWFDACNKQCKVDFVAFHWYDSASNFEYFKTHVEDVIATAQKNGVDKVWVTEFGASGSDSEVASFLSQAVEYLDSNDAVERYAYFMCSDGILVNGDSVSSPVGTTYAG